MIAEPISKPDRAATFVTLSYGCLVADIAIGLLLFDLDVSGTMRGDLNFIVESVLLFLAFILPLAGMLFGRLGMRSGSTESVSKKARRGRQLNAVMGVVVFILFLFFALIHIGCACAFGNTFTAITSALPS